MPLIAINLEETPEKLPPIEVGIRTLRISDIKEMNDKQGNSFQSVEFEVDQPGSPDQGRKGWDRFNFEYPAAKTKFKTLVLAAGLDASSPDGVDTSELIGKVVKASVKSRTYQYEETGETVHTTQISKYIYGSDA